MIMRIFIGTILSIFFLMGDFSTPVILSESSEMAPSDTLIEMERTVCFGTCPSYELAIHGNGQVIFDGKQFVEHKGIAKGEISQTNLNALIQLIQEINFMEIPSDPECDSWMTDHPSVFLTVEIGDQRNSITHYQGCKGFEYEEELYRLETAIDSLAGAQKWIGNS